MPSFSFPATVSVTSKPGRGASKKKNKKVVEEPAEEPVEEPAEEPAEEPVEEPAEEPVEEPAEEPVEEPYDTISNDDIRQEPTFPDVVILKQTDKNYIVKHNHYVMSGQATAKNRENTISHEGGATEHSIDTHLGTKIGNSNRVGPTILTQQANPSTDLVSPNQIYKGQINKKRGRKPKAGFILNSNVGMYDSSEVPNIILHLKCHLSDLKSNESISNFDYTPSISEVESYNLSTTILNSSEITHSYNSDTNIDNNDEDELEHMNTVKPALNEMKPVITTNVQVGTAHNKKLATEANIHVINERHQKEIMKKINRLKYSFHNGETIQMKLNHKSACFWDTCEFDGPIYYTPIMIVNGVFHVSGCYCSPECALASLLKEQMDTSTKFERIHLLHLLYGSSNSNGFKPAPNPNYLLDKYYGNLTIDEFRSLLKGPQMIHVVNKPLTHILPELYEDNNDFIVNSKVIPSNTVKLKKRYKTTLVQNCGAD
jgi:hypothetical protein